MEKWRRELEGGRCEDGEMKTFCGVFAICGGFWGVGCFWGFVGWRCWGRFLRFFCFLLHREKRRRHRGARREKVSWDWLINNIVSERLVSLYLIRQ